MIMFISIRFNNRTPKASYQLILGVIPLKNFPTG